MSNVPRGYPGCHQNLQILTNFQMDVQSRNRLQASTLDLFKISIAKQVAGAERTVCGIKAIKEKVINPYFSLLFSEVLISFFFTVKEFVPQPIRQSNPQNLEMTFSLSALNVHNASVSFCIDHINKHASYVHMYLLYHIYGNKCFAMLHYSKLERE